MNDDDNAREAYAARDEQRRHPREYPCTREEQLRNDFTPGDELQAVEEKAWQEFDRATSDQMKYLTSWLNARSALRRAKAQQQLTHDH